MTLKMEKLVKSYQTFARIPSLVNASISAENIISSLWSQRNIERGKTSKYLRSFVVCDEKKVVETFPVDVTTEVLVKVSPSEKLRAVLRESDSVQYLEIWKNSNQIRAVDLTGLELHGPVYTDVEFAALEWSQDDKKVLYVAEKKEEKKVPFYKRKAKNGLINVESIDKIKGVEHVFEQDWGEQLVGKKKSILVEYDIEQDLVKILTGTPDQVCVAQPKYTKNGNAVIGVAYKTEPRKLGLIYCTNRPSAVFQLDLETSTYVEVPNEKTACKSPILTPDGSQIVWLQRPSGGPHGGAMQLVKADLPITKTTEPKVVVDIVRTSIDIEGGKLFYGLYNSGFPARCWASDNRLLLSTNQENRVASYIINIGTGSIEELKCGEEKDSLVVLDVNNDTILAAKRNFFVPDVLVMAKLPNLTWTNITESAVVPGFENKKYNYIKLEHPNDSVSEFSAIYVGPASGETKKVPLIVFPHGGPHSSFGNYLFMECNMLLASDYAILLINYRGSIGVGQDSVDYLLGKVGVADVADCILATDKALSQFPWLDPESVSLVGGSHGGFLVTHLSGQYPDRFQSVVARNPVIDIASMSIASDIPDWCFVETGVEYTQVGAMDDELMVKMRQASPIAHAHKVKAPTLLQIGSKDLRVPPMQGTDYYHRLKANGVTVRMNLYEDNHPLGTVPNEMDNIINTVLWVDEHLGKC